MQMRIKNIGRTLIRSTTAVSFVRNQLRKATRSGVLPRKFWGKLPVETTFTVKLPHGIEFLYCSTAYDGIGRQLFWAGEKHWEYETISLFCLLATKSKRVLDIGANTGIYSLIACAANPKTHVTAFEPVPRIREQLQQSIAENQFQIRCQVRNEAISDEFGTARFHVPSSALPTTASLHQDGFRGTKGEHIEVPLTTIDKLLGEEDPVDLIKIDVEGFEDHALRGMEKLIQNHKPIIILECNYDGPIDALEKLIAQHNIPLYHLLPDGPKRVDGFNRDKSDKYRNFMLLPNEKSDWIKQ